MKFEPTYTIGHVLTAGSVICSALVLAFGSPGDMIRVQAQVTSLEAARVASEIRDAKFQDDVRVELRAIRREIQENQLANGVRWRDLPPSPYQRSR
jgi:hypothetical protein